MCSLSHKCVYLIPRDLTTSGNQRHVTDAGRCLLATLAPQTVKDVDKSFGIKFEADMEDHSF